MKINRTTLADNPELYNATVRLIEKSFNYPPGHSFEDDFYNLLSPVNHKHNHILVDGDTVVAHIGVNLKEISKNDTSCLVAFIGGVAVNENDRGQGHFRDLFSYVVDKYSESCAFFLLWSDKSELYKKYDFYEFGAVSQLGAFEEDEEYFNSIGFSKTKLKTLSEPEVKELHQLYKHNFNSYLAPKRTPRVWDSIASIKTTDLYIQRDGAKISNYFFINKGFDLPSVIHESSFFNDEALLEKFKDFKLWLPEKHSTYIEVNSSLYIGIMKVANTALFSDFIRKIFSNDLLIAEVIDGNVEFSFKEEEFTLPLDEFFHFIFGPHPAEEFLPYGNWFFIPGLDSI